VTDASGNLVNNGEVYSFSLPSACTDGCPTSYTPVSYTTSTGPGTGSSPTPTPSPTTSSARSCSLTSSVVTSWSGGYQLQLTVANNGTTPLSGWTAGFTFADTAESISSSWNAALTQSGTQVTAVNESYNAAVSPGGSTTFGMTVNGLSSTLAGLTCTPT
jgi:cellulase/cellobiase CelA1